MGLFERFSADATAVPDSPPKLVEHAQLLQREAQRILKDHLVLGAMAGLLAGSAFLWILARIDGPGGGGTLLVIQFLIVETIAIAGGAYSGAYLAAGRVSRLVSTAAVIQAVARIESSLSERRN